eukprot:scaffold132813_cov21-Phaeocystis_antarctica.AAC.1
MSENLQPSSVRKFTGEPRPLANRPDSNPGLTGQARTGLTGLPLTRSGPCLGQFVGQADMPFDFFMSRYKEAYVGET